MIPQLSAGNYQITIQDLNDCSIIESATIQSSSDLYLNLGSDTEIILGDSVQINAETNFDVAQYIWNPEEIFKLSELPRSNCKTF